MRELSVFMRIILAAALLLAVTPLFTAQVAAVLQTNTVANSGFESSASNPWHKVSTYGNGTVILYDNTRAHSGSYSSMLGAVNNTSCLSVECKDTVRATVEQYFQSPAPPTLNHLDNSVNSFSAWWYVAPSTLSTYSLHIGLSFSDGSSIEYWYGQSDLANSTVKYTSAAYNLGPIPASGSWFQMNRNLTADIQGVVADRSTARITALWLGAFGGTYNSVPRGETAWVDDVALNFNTGLVAAFSSNPASGPAALTVRFNASQSYETGGSSAPIVNYQWNFGDGTVHMNTTAPTTTHTYGSPGTFPVTLTVKDGYGVESQASSTITVGPSDVSIPLLVGGGGGVLLLGGILFAKLRRRPSKMKKTKPKLRKG